MRVLHILGAPLHSGAGRGVRALHEELLSANVDSRILGRVEKGLPPQLRATPVSVQQYVLGGVGNRFSRWRFRRRHGQLHNSFDPLAYGLNIQKIPQYGDADIVHIQWVSAATLGPAFWRALKAEQRPVVWTLRDMWPFTGGCHFSDNCTGL